MMHEEFTQLAKVETTAKYYKEVIEPKYAASGLDKEVFVAQWLKDNKASLVKAHAFDLDRASTALAVKDCKAAELERARAESKRLQHQAETFETNFKAAHSSWKEAEHMAEGWKNDYHAARKEAEQVGPLNDRINELENEITRLKAMLFDAMYNGSKAA